MRYLLIAEKPSVMKSIEECYNNHKQEIVNALGGEIDFTAASGHLCGLYEPDDYPEWHKAWAECQYPMVPQKFKVKALPGRATEKLNYIKTTLSKRDDYVLINSCDSDDQGSLIFHLICDYLQLGQYKALRFFEQSMAEKDILNSLLNMTDNWHNPRDVHMTQSALARSRHDWLWGMNGTRYASVKTGQTLNIGRVKVPTLYMIYKRCQDIDNFTPHSSYQPQAFFKEGFSGLYTVDGKTPEDYETAQLAQNVIDELAGSTTGTVKEVKRTNKKQEPKKLFKLSSLQEEVGKYSKGPYALPDGRTMDGEKLLSCIETLYQNGFLSYPRSDGEYLKEEQAKSFGQMLRSCAKIPELLPYIKSLNQEIVDAAKRNPSIVNDKKASEEAHTAIVMTEKIPDFASFSPEEKLVYYIIARRFLAWFLPLRETESTTALVDISDHLFKCNSSQETAAGWHSLYSGDIQEKSDEESEEEKNRIPSSLNKGDIVNIDHFALHEKVAKPPVRYTMTSIIIAMEEVSKLIEEKDLAKVMKQAKGIGTPATRSAILQQLVDKGYISVKGKKNEIYIENKGKEYVELLEKMPPMVEPAEAARWETTFDAVRRGEVDYREAQAQSVQYVINFIHNIDQLGITPKPKEYGGAFNVKCPWCGGKIIPTKMAYSCENHFNNGPCGFFVYHSSGKVSREEFINLIEKGKTKTISKIFKSKSGELMSAKLVLNPKGSQYPTKYEFPKTRKQK